MARYQFRLSLGPYLNLKPEQELPAGLTWENPVAVLTAPWQGEGIDPRRLAALLAGSLAVLYVIFA